jgi:HK97 family phage portal protein
MPIRQVKAADWGRPISPVKVEKSSAANPMILRQLGGASAVWSSRDLRTFVKEGYMQNADGYACINWIATVISGIDFHAYQGDDDDLEQITEGPAHKIANRPNDQQSWSAFIKEVVVSLLATGNAFIERVGPSPNKPPRELYCHKPHRVRILPGNAQNLVRGYDYFEWAQEESGKKPLWLPDFIRRDGILTPVHQILHLKFYHPLNDFWGLSPMEPAARSLDQNNAAETWNAAMLQNGGRPSGILSFENIDDEQRELIEDKFQQKHGGPQNVGKTIVIQGGEASYTSVSMNAQEMSWLEGQERATTRVCAVFRVPPELIGNTKYRTFNNMHEAIRAGYMEGALPHYDFIIDELNYWLAPFYGDNVKFGYDKNDIEAIQEDRQYVADRAVRFVQAGIFTPNDARRAINEDALPEETGDVLLLPTNVVPTPVDGKMPKPAVVTPVAQPAALPAAPDPNNTPPRLALVPRRNT